MKAAVPFSLAAGLCALLLSPAEAQVGTGYWKEYYPRGTVQERGGGAQYAASGAIETFTTRAGDERCEMRVQDDYNSGVRQFEGLVRIRAGSGGTSGNAGDAAGACIHQVFKFLMIVVYNLNGGELRQHSYNDLGTRNAYDRWIRINTIHDVDRRRAEVWIDGVQKLSFAAGTSGGPNGFYHKYGVYNGSGTNPLIEWRDVRFWEASRDPIAVKPPDDPAGADRASMSFISGVPQAGETRVAWGISGRRIKVTGSAAAAGAYIILPGR